MLTWFDADPTRYWWLLSLVGAATVFMLLRPFHRPDWKDERGTDWGWSPVIVALLAAGRWPTWFLTRQLNSDESQFIAGAFALRHDPVFWRSVDGMTVGPIDFYALQPVGWIVGHDGYFSARVTACLLLAFALVFVHQSLALIFGRQVARLTVLPAVCLEALTIHTDFLHYSSELVPMALLAAAFFLFARRLAAGAGWWGNAAAGLILGAVPFAKLQAAPPAALLGVVWLVLEIREPCTNIPSDRNRRLLALLAGAVTPMLICIAFLSANGLWHYATTAYIRHNLAYVDETGQSLREALAGLGQSALRGNSLLPHWLAGGLLWLLLSLPLAKAPDRVGRLIAGTATLLFLASLFGVLVPSRSFLHYCQLLVVPWTLVVGATTGLIVLGLKQRRILVRAGVLCAALLCCGGGLLYARIGLPAPAVGRLAIAQTAPRGAVACELVKYARPGEALGIWGWMSQFYVEAGLRQATRRADSSAEIPSSPFRDFFHNVYLADLQRSAPPVFVDATGPGNAVFSDRHDSFELSFPALAAYIHTHYVPAGEIEGARIYVRRDRWSARVK